MTGIDPRIAERRARVAEGRARRGLVRLLVLLSVLAGAAAVVWLFRSPFLSIQSLLVEGAVRSGAEQTLAEQGVVEGVPLVTLDPGAVEAALEEDPWVADAVVRREWPQRVVVTVEERRPVAWVRAGTEWLHVAVDGVALERGAPEEGAPILLLSRAGEAPLPEDPAARGGLRFLAALPARLREGAVLRAAEEEMAASVAGYEVRLGLPTEMEEKARSLAAVIDTGPEEGSVITVVAPTRPAVLPASARTTTTTAAGEAPGGDAGGAGGEG